MIDDLIGMDQIRTRSLHQCAQDQVDVSEPEKHKPAPHIISPATAIGDSPSGCVASLAHRKANANLNGSMGEASMQPKFQEATHSLRMPIAMTKLQSPGSIPPHGLRAQIKPWEPACNSNVDRGRAPTRSVARTPSLSHEDQARSARLSNQHVPLSQAAQPHLKAAEGLAAEGHAVRNARQVSAASKRLLRLPEALYATQGVQSGKVEGPEQNAAPNGQRRSIGFIATSFEGLHGDAATGSSPRGEENAGKKMKSKEVSDWGLIGWLECFCAYRSGYRISFSQ
jgi:hypothetical protein